MLISVTFSDSSNLDVPKPIKYDNSDSSQLNFDTSSSEDESSKTTYPANPDTSLNDTSSYKTNINTHDSNPSNTRIRLSADNISFPSHINPSNDRHLDSHYQLRQQPRR